jgi:endoglucanase
MRGTKAIINPSYIMPRALYDLAALIRDPRLASAATDGITLLEELAERDLVPNWVELDGAGVRPSSEQPGLFGYDAMRVALYLIWSGRRGRAAVRRAHDLYAAQPLSDTPVVVGLDGASVQETSTYAGFANLRSLVAGQAAEPAGLDVAQGYSPATLQMLCRIAAEESSPALAAA